MEVLELITNIGFPMAFCIIIYLDSRKDKERLFNTIDSFGEKMDKFDQTLQGIDTRLKELEERK